MKRLDIWTSRVTCVDRTLRRRRWIIRRKLEHWKSGKIATALRIDERTVYRWWRGYRSEGREGLRVKSRRPHHYYKTPQVTVNFILELRRSKHWRPNKIEGYARNYKVQGITPVSHRTIHGVLVEAGLNNPIPPPGRGWAKGRFERERSTSLWQGDFKLTEKDEWIGACRESQS